MNERDSEQVAQTFADRGYTLTPKEQDADAILVNTCSVRDQAEQKALGKMGMMGKHREERPHVVYGFMGCMAQSRGSELFDRVPHLDLVVGTQKYHRVFDYVDSILSRRLETRMDDVGPEMISGRVEDEVIKINQDRVISARLVDIEEEEGSPHRDLCPAAFETETLATRARGRCGAARKGAGKIASENAPPESCSALALC